MLSKILAKAALKPRKFQANFLFQKLEMVSSNLSAKISISIKSGNQQVETIQRPKASYETELDENLSFITSIFYEEFKHKYQEKLLQIDVNLHSATGFQLIGFGKVDLSQFAALSFQNPFENDVILVLEKSPEYQAKLSFHLTLTYLGEEESSNSLLKKLKEAPSSQEKPSTSRILAAIIPSALPKPSRSLTPSRTPKSQRNSTNLNQKEEPTRKTVGAKFQQVANKVLLMKNATTKIVKRSVSKSPLPRQREAYKPVQITEPLFRNKYSNVFEERSAVEGKINEIKQEKETNLAKLNEITTILHEKEKACQNYNERIKELEFSNSKLRKEIEKNRSEFRKTNEMVVNSVVSETKKPVLEEKINGFDDSLHREKLAEAEHDFSRLKGEKENLEKEVFGLKEENGKLAESIKEMNGEINERNKTIEEINKQQMDLKNSFINLKEKQPNLLNKNKINDLFSDSSKKIKELEIQNKTLDSQISQGNDEIVKRENRYFEEENLLEEIKEALPEKTKEKLLIKEKMNGLEVEVKKLQENLNEKEKKKIEMMELTMVHQDEYVKTKQDIADIFNLVFEKGSDDLMDEMEKYLN